MGVKIGAEVDTRKESLRCIRDDKSKALTESAEIYCSTSRRSYSYAGKLTTYGTLANAIGNRNAFRAVGTAIGQNEIGYLIPCHRVIRKTGVVGDYRWGAMRKQAIVAGEIARNSTEIGLSQQNG